MTAAPASDAESLSCATAARYAGRWARSVARPVDGDEDRPHPPAPWFVDGFAGADLQRAALRGATVQPAAILTGREVDDATGGRARIVLIEEDPGLLSRLGELLDGIGAGGRVRIGSDPATAEPGEILLVEASFASHAHRLAQRIGEEPALVRLAPLAARALPWTALEPVAGLAHTDVLLRFPREDFEKQARFTGPLADLPPHLRRVVEGCSSFLEDARHGWLMAWREAQRAAGPDAALATAIERMQALLASAGEDRVTPALHVAGRTESVHLLLSTPHPAHPRELTDALADGAARPKPSSKRKSAASPNAESPPPAESAASAAEPAAEPPPSDATKEPHAVDEPAAALDLFPVAPEPEPEPRDPESTEPRPATPRARKPRTPAPDLLSLFDEPEE